MKNLHRLNWLVGACLSACAMASAQAAPKRPAKAPAPAVSSHEAELMQRLDQLSGELEKVKAQLAELKQQAAANAAPTSAVVVAPAPAPAPVAQAAAPAAVPPAINGGDAVATNAPASEPATVLTGYGEIAYNNYNRDKSNNQADLRRFVLGLQHRFDAKTKLVTELEVEHTVSSASDEGEVEVEQAYIERQLSNQWALRAGLFLMPAGLLNENHEPTAYYGVERNFVETAIIPSTWREGGLQLVGNLDNGLTIQGGLSTGFNMSKWAFDDSETAESPLGATHQELSNAKAKEPAVFAAVNWRGVPGLLLGASWFSGNGTQARTVEPGQGLHVTLWDLHARYMVAGLDLSTVYTRGTIGGTADINTRNPGVGPDWYPIPKRFDGAYVQAAYKLWAHDDLALSPFVRLERFNTRKSFADVGEGLTAPAQPSEQVATLGANLNVGQGLVFKVDVQRFKQDKDKNRFDLGMGWSF
ncbi:MAG: porin [Aquabacterium sp.]